MNYFEFRFNINPRNPWEEIITQALADIGFDSFMEENEELLAYICEDEFNSETFQDTIQSYENEPISIDFTKTIIPEQNWNAQWESDYPIVTIEKHLIIRAPFHSADPTFEHELIIQPQMSFGTGHHQTTYLLCKALLTFDFKDKTVLDIGTGTGVLGILASKLGAKEVFGTDIEERAIENADENIKRNEIFNFKLKKGDIDCVPNRQVDVILANINRNVLLRHMQDYSKLIKVNGTLFLSGFFETDVKKLVDCANSFNFIQVDSFTKDKWCVLKLLKQN